MIELDDVRAAVLLLARQLRLSPDAHPGPCWCGRVFAIGWRSADGLSYCTVAHAAEALDLTGAECALAAAP